MNPCEPMQVVIHYPKSEKSMQALSRQISDQAAEFVLSSLCRKNCPADQKFELLRAVIRTAQKAASLE